MLGRHGPHLLVGCEFTALSGGLRAGNRLALFGRKDNRRSRIRACKRHDGARDVILIVGRQATHGLNYFIEELCHGRNIRLGEVEVEELAAVWRLDGASGGCRRIRAAMSCKIIKWRATCLVERSKMSDM